MAYATLSQFRSVTNFKSTDISDNEVNAMVADADRAIVRLTTTEVYLEQLTGNVDGTNVDFRTSHRPLADLDASGSVTADDVKIFYATFDSVTNWRELGSAQTVSAILDKEGIITMQTAPTNVTAEAGVFAIYRYESRGDTNVEVYNLASTYFLAYMAANKLEGRVPDYNLTDISVREDIVRKDWLGLVYETLGLQDKLFLDAPRGFGIPPMNVNGSSNDQYCSAKRGAYCGGGF